ncbi:tetratricopeptide repeat protein [Brevibacillus centrosporus]|uniref:tetratricopeptide repeat protein n=1 Tax=Brevibacillus centrosporus TaxID=54910 RepID=UPI003B027C6A
MSEFVSFTNEFGQTIDMSREDYQKKVIPHNLDMYWDNKEKLRDFAMELVKEQFHEQAAVAANRLLELYGPIESALIFRAVVHMQAREFDRAKAILSDCLERFPSSGTACTNLAKIYAYEGDEAKAFETLNTGLHKDPNQENGLNMYVESFLQSGRKEELRQQLETLASKEGAWRPQLHLARLALTEENLLKAMHWYTLAIEGAKDRFEVVMTVTGELGQAGYVYQLIQICEKFWTPDFPFPYAGFNYANALIATDQKEKAIAILRNMQEQLADNYKPMVDHFLLRVPGAQEVEGAAAAKVAQGQPADAGTKKGWWKIWK